MYAWLFMQVKASIGTNQEQEQVQSYVLYTIGIKHLLQETAPRLGGQALQHFYHVLTHYYMQAPMVKFCSTGKAKRLLLNELHGTVTKQASLLPFSSSPSPPPATI